MTKNKLVPRTELLQFCRETQPETGTLLGKVWDYLAKGEVISLSDWEYASLAYEEAKTAGSPEPLQHVAQQGTPAEGTVLGSYRLQTAAGPVVFTAVQGIRSIDIYVAPGLNLPGQWSELDMQRSIEFGKPVNFDNIKDLINAN